MESADQSKLDSSQANTQSDISRVGLNGNTLEMSPDQEQLTDSVIATLDVTSEEINVADKCWKDAHQRRSFQDNIVHDDDDDSIVHAHQRQRSETWTAGTSEKSADIGRTVHNFHSSVALDNLNIAAPSKLCNGHVFDADIKDGVHEHQNTSKENGNNRFLHKHGRKYSSTEHLDKDLQQEHAKTDLPGTSSVSYTNNLTGDSNEDLQSSEFTDINLQVCDEFKSGSEELIDEQSLARMQQQQPSRPSLGSLFGWISVKNSPSQSNNGSAQVSPLRSLPAGDTSNTSTYEEDHNGAGTDVVDSSLKSQQLASDATKNDVRKQSSNTTSNKGRRWFWKNRIVEPLSTTALILENRPRNLPQKPIQEAQKHQLEYEKMVEHVKKHEIKEMQKKKRQLKEQRKHEDVIASTSTVWSNEILPNWNAMHLTNKTRQLWWQGLPSNVRGKVWQLAIGNELNITRDLYEIMVTRAHDKLRTMHETQSMGEDTESLAVDRESTVELIRLDISRTFPVLCIFQKGGPYHDTLHDILGAYVCYRPDIGYVQGMSFMAAMLLLNMDPSDAFATFANLLNKPCQLTFFRLNEEMMKVYFASYEVFFEENLPKLFAHFKQYNLTPDMYLIDWIFTMFSKALSFDTACRVWDLFCRDGEELLFKSAIAILKLHEDVLLSMEFIHAAQFLTRLPTSGFTHHELFRHISDVTMVSRGNRRWKDVLALLRRDDAT